jgi:hypothetical protein
MKMLFLILFLMPFAAVRAHADAAPPPPKPSTVGASTGAGTGTTRTIYPENQTIDFEGLSLEGELKAPGEFYFQNRNQERFDSLTKRRLNFRREMLRDSIQSN